MQHRKEQIKHTRTPEQKIKDNLKNKKENGNVENIIKKKFSKIQDTDPEEIVFSEDRGPVSRINTSGGNFIYFF